MDNIYKFLLIVVLVLVLFIFNKNYKENFNWININNEVT